MTQQECVIGGGAGFAGDRVDATAELVRSVKLDALILECLAERTIALAHQRMRRGEGGFDPLLRKRFEPLFGIKELPPIVTNLGAADPRGAQKALASLASAHGRNPVIAAVTGDDVLDHVRDGLIDDPFIAKLVEERTVVSANAYIGSSPVVEALHEGADVVIGGRIADPSLVVAPVAWKLGWALEDFERIATATVAGHLLECGAQVTGGYFSDPGLKEVPRLERVGLPFARITEDQVIVSKTPGTGGIVNHRTVREQLLYEISDPHAYLTPDATVAFDQLQVHETKAGVAITGFHGAAPPKNLKVSIGYDAGYRVEAAISYQGGRASRRARQALEVVQERTRLPLHALHAEFIDGWTDGHAHSRLYIHVISKHQNTVRAVAREVEALGTNGPAGGGGWRAQVQPALGIASAYIPRTAVEPRVHVCKVVTKCA